MYLISRFTIFFILYLSGYSLLAQVGINTISPETMLDIKGNLSLNASSLSLGNGDNNIAGGDHPLFNVTGPVDHFNINTIQPLAEVDGQLITLVNNTNNFMTLVNNDNAGVNSISCPNNSDLILKGIYTTVTLQYNKTLQRWVVIKYADGDVYQRRIHSKAGTSNIQTNSTTFTDMGTDMSITFTPKNSVVYVNVSLSGHMFTGYPNADAHGYADFRVVKTVGSINTVIAGFTNIATDVDYLVVATPWNSRMAMYPVSVVPGESTILKIQWRRDGQHPYTLYCSASSIPSISHRSITIFD